MSRSYLTNCPRCGSRSFEHLESYSHCIECLYSPDFNKPIAKPNFITLREAEAFLREKNVHDDLPQSLPNQEAVS